MPKDSWRTASGSYRSAVRRGKRDNPHQVQFGGKKKRRKKSRGRYRMAFGMHKGKLLADVPAGYLRWVAENCELTGRTYSAVYEECRKRGLPLPKRRAKGVEPPGEVAPPGVSEADYTTAEFNAMTANGLLEPRPDFPS